MGGKHATQGVWKRALVAVVLALAVPGTTWATSPAGGGRMVRVSPIPYPPQPSARVMGAPGKAAAYYWVTAVYPAGETVAVPVCVPNLPQPLSASNFVRLSWPSLEGATGYKVYKTTTPLYPSGGVDLLCTSSVNACNDIGTAKRTGDPPVTSPPSTIPAAPRVTDAGGQVFNVKAFGASGNGVDDDSASVQAAVDAAFAAGGGKVYFPQGKFLINRTVSDTKLNFVGIEGAGPEATEIKVNTGLGFDLGWYNAGNVNGLQGGFIRNLRVTCLSLADTAFRTTDMNGAGPRGENLQIMNCEQGFDFVNKAGWTERISMNHVSGFNNRHLFHFDQQAKGPDNSFGYAVFEDIHIATYAGQDAYYATNGAYVYHGIFDVQGNIYGAPGNPSYLFNTTGSAGFTGRFRIFVEGSNYYAFNSTGALSGIYGSATMRLSDPTGVSTPGSIVYVTETSEVAQNVGSLSTTASASDTASVAATNSSQCFVSPTNSLAAGMTGVFVSAVTWGRVTVTHPAQAGATFYIWCNEPY